MMEWSSNFDTELHRIFEVLLRLYDYQMSLNIELTLSQKLFITIIILGALTVLIWAFGIAYKLFFLTRRWCRRKAIPKTIDLHLDRDANHKDFSEDKAKKTARGRYYFTIFLSSVVVSFCFLYLLKNKESMSLWEQPFLSMNNAGYDLVKYYDQNTLDISEIKNCMIIKHEFESVSSHVQSLQLHAHNYYKNNSAIDFSKSPSTKMSNYNQLLQELDQMTQNREQIKAQFRDYCLGKRYYLDDYKYASFSN